MNRVFYDCIDVFLVVYMDDLLVFSKSRDEHLGHLETVLSRLENEKLYVSPKKCQFMQHETEFLGMLVGRDGIRVNPDKLQVVRDWPRPRSLTELRSFMGLLQFFRRFIRRFSHIAAPMTNLTKKGIGISRWDEECDCAFQKLKEAITTAPVLVSPDWQKPFRCHVDASQRAVGGTLAQLDDKGVDRVVAYYSRKLSSAEQDYTANERELLGLVYCLKRFRCYLECASFDVFTDNQVLKHFFTKPGLNRKEARWLDLLSQFNIRQINLKPGRIQVLGDALSRAPHVMNETELELGNFEASSPVWNIIQGKYEADQLFGPIVKALGGELPTDPIQRERVSRLSPLFQQKDKLLYYGKRVCVPRSIVRDILHMAHDARVAGHFAFAKTLARLDKFHWKHKTRDVRKYCDGCIVCQQRKDSRLRKLSEPTPLEVPSRRWGSLATDFIVSLPVTKNGFDSITTWVDRLSRRVHFIPSKSTDSAVDVANLFFSNVFKHHGLPDNILSDRDPKFTSKFWARLMDLCGIHTKMSTSHHPQTDGISEVMNRLIENYIRCYCSFHQHDWDELLPAAEFAHNSALSVDLGASPFEVDLGWQPRSLVDLLGQADVDVGYVKDFRDRMREALHDARFSHQLAKARQSAYSAQKHTPPSYKVGDSVWIQKALFKDAISRTQASDKLGARRFGPFEITELVGRNAIRLALPAHIRIHPVWNIAHNIPYRQQPSDICQPFPTLPVPVTSAGGDSFVVDKILGHRKRGRGYQWLTLMKDAPQHDAQWQPTKDFVDNDGTLTKAFHDYLIAHNLLPHLH